MDTINVKDPIYYTNRELSWLQFDERILEEARDKTNPLFERLKFLSITASNLDEFFMVRVASLKDMINAKYTKKDLSGMTPQEQLDEILKRTKEFMSLQYSTYNRSLLPLLAQNGLRIVESYEDMTPNQAEYADSYFHEFVYPVLTPMAVDSSRPFPLIRNKSLNIGALIKKKEDKTLIVEDPAAENKAEGSKEKSKKKKNENEVEFATVQVPAVLPRIVALPQNEAGERCIILLEEIIERNMSSLFLNYDIICAHPYRVMRNADMSIDEDDASDLLKEIEKQLKKRQWGEVIRLEIEDGMNAKLLKTLKKDLDVKDESIYEISGPQDLTFLMKLYGLEGYDHLKTPKHIPAHVPELPAGCNIFDEIGKRDILLHHPYQTFDPVVQLIKSASVDPQVLAIKQTLYRVSGNSPIVAALAKAAENGKQVSVLVELKARFDEENNINWARMLEKAGCHVIYGLVGLKTHSKITLVVRKEEDGIRRYVHLGTGNYNDSTAKLYTDLGLLTCSNQIGEDATAVFNMLSGYSEPLEWRKLSLAPLWLRDRFVALIRREAEHARRGNEAYIKAKVNSLCDRDMIAELYEAAIAGVKIDLVVRGICCIKTGIPGVSENITVRSVVGNFLEHSRIFIFGNNGNEEVYCASADWMPRNLDRRVEIMFPIEQDDLKAKVIDILDTLLSDNLKARVMQPDGLYKKVDLRGKTPLCAQDYFAVEAKRIASIASDPVSQRVFIPQEHIEE